MKIITLRVPKDGNTFYEKPCRELLENVLYNPERFGDEKELGGVAIYCRPQDDIQVESHRTPECSELNFYFNHEGFAALKYSDDSIDTEVITAGSHLSGSELLVEDRGGAEVSIKSSNLIPISEALDLAIEFCEKGYLSVDDSWEPAPY